MELIMQPIHCSTMKKDKQKPKNKKRTTPTFANNNIPKLVIEAGGHINAISKTAVVKNSNMKRKIRKTRQCLTQILDLSYKRNIRLNNAEQLLDVLKLQNLKDKDLIQHFIENITKINDTQTDIYAILNQQMGYLQHIGNQYQLLEQRLNPNLETANLVNNSTIIHVRPEATQK